MGNRPNSKQKPPTGLSSNLKAAFFLFEPGEDVFCFLVRISSSELWCYVVINDNGLFFFYFANICILIPDFAVEVLVSITPNKSGHFTPPKFSKSIKPVF
jgi:hypothetical protein